jgi:hypothetical protein
MKLKAARIMKTEKDGKRYFEIESGEKVFTFHSDDEDDQNRWIMSMKAGFNLNPSQPPVKNLQIKKNNNTFIY